MSIFKLFVKITDWFVPDDFFEDKDLLLRSRLLVIISLLSVAWTLGRFRVGPLSLAFGIPLAVFVLLMPLLLKQTKSNFWAGHGLVLVLFLTNFYRGYWEGGFNPIILWWHVLPPLVAVMLIGNRSGFFWIFVSIISIFTFSYLESSYMEMPGDYDLPDIGILVYSILLTAILTVISMYMEKSKNFALSYQDKEVQKSKVLADDMQNIAFQIKKNTDTISSSSNVLTTSLHSMRDSAQEMAQIESEAATAVVQSTSTIQELASSLGETVKKMKQLEKLALSVEEMGAQGAVNVKLSAQAMAKINEGRQEYDTILQAITDIADSAHLLSLNAAIEAAKAGEFGKGFFVVVEEIRDLANRSNDAVVDIRKVMKKGGFVILRGKNVINSLADVFSIVSQLIDNISGQLKEVTMAIEEQDIGIREIAKGTDEIAHASEENVTLVQELNQSLEDNTKTIENLHQIAKQLEEKSIEFGIQID